MRVPIVRLSESEYLEQFYLRALFGSADLPPLSKIGILPRLRLLHQTYLSGSAQRLKFTPELSRAYALYFGLVNSIKLYGVLKNYLEAITLSSRILDFGAGTGALIPALELLGFKGQYYGYDKEKSQIQIAQKLSNHVHFECEFNFESWFEFDSIVVANVLCEMNRNQVFRELAKMVRKLSSNGSLVLIEPGDRLNSQRLVTLKPFLKSLGFKTFFPCPSDSECPLSKGKDWCHGVVQVDRGRLLLTLDKFLGLNHHRLAYSILVCQLTPPTTSLPTVLRTRKVKRAIVAEVCLGERVVSVRVTQDRKPFDRLITTDCELSEA